MNKGVKIAAAVIGGLVVIALVAPMFVNLNNYKGLIAQKAKEATGRDLTITGDISLSLLPMPAVSIEGVKFGNAPGASQPDMVTLEQAKVKVALLPLISGNVQIREVVLSKPVILLEKLRDGGANWQIKPAGEPNASPGETKKAAGDATKETAASAGMNIAVDSASIEDGTLIYRDDASGSEQKVENINVDLSMESLEGPFEAKGGVTALGAPLGFTVKLGKMNTGKPMPVDVSLAVSEAAATLGFVGQADLGAASDPQKPIVTGKLSGKGDSVAKLLAALPGGDKSAVQPPLLAEPFSLNGDVTAGSASATVPSLSFQLGDLTAKAALAANYAKDIAVQANVAVGRVDLDKLLSAGGREKKAEAETPATKPTGQNDLAGAGRGFSLPSGITAGADVTVQQIVYQGQSIDNTKLSAQLTNGQVTLKSLTAQLPGASGLGASGVLYADQGQPAFTGGLKLNAGNLRALIDAFAKGAVDAVPGDRLRSFALSSEIAFKNQQLDLTELTVQLDQSTIQGGGTIALPDGKQRQQMGFGIGLSIDKLNLDGYLPKADQKPAATQTSATQTAAKPAPSGNPLKALAPLADLNANLEARVGALTMNQQQINGLHALIAIGGGAINIKDISVADFLGGKGAITGKVTDLKGDPRFDTNFDITAKDAGNVFQMAGAGAQQPGKFGALTLSGKAGGNANDVSYDVNLGMAGIGAQGSAKGGISGLLAGGIPKINSNFDLRARDTSALAVLAGMPADAAEDLGAVALSGTAQSGSDDLTYDVSLSASGVGASGKLGGKLTGLSGDNPQVDTKLDLNAQKPGPLLRLAGLGGPKANAAGALGIGGTLKGGADKMALDLKLQGLGGNAALVGTVQAKAKPIAFDISLTADHPQFSDLLRLADLPSSGVQAGPLKMSAKAAGTTDKAQVSALSAAWGDSSLNGTANYDATGARPQIVANITGGTVNLIPFMGNAEGGAGGGKSDSKASSSGAPAGVWSEEKLDLSMLDKQDATVDFQAKSLILPDQRIDDLVAKIILKDGLLTMQTLNGKIYGGGFNLSGTTVNGRGTPKVDAKVAVDKIQIGQVMGGGIAGSQVKGPVSLNLDLLGSGDSQAALVRSLTGKGNLDGTLKIIGKVEQKLGSALLDVLGKKVKQVQSLTDTINGILGNFTGVDNALKGSFNIAKGVLDTQDFAFTNPKAHGMAKGQIDLAAMAFSKMLVDLFGANADKAFMSVNLEGPLSNPRPSFASNGAAGAGGLLGIDNSGKVQPDALEKLPGGEKLLKKLGVQPNNSVPAEGATPQSSVSKKPTVEVPGLGAIELPFGKKKKKKDKEQVPAPQSAPAETPSQSTPGNEPASSNQPAASEPAPAEPAPAEPAPEQQSQ
ncbi:AsmA family protein [Dongia soli]|uniref:AsmA family protein n=1 Tax=Dongia soli TaxID=600628 RepID=A0ABU5EDK4_9PROT|nr:AsmA family protein [Dongia soli]MDY0884291.1 AsmA family protein [Dongia soli]